jgi:hypothetical protein
LSDDDKTDLDYLTKKAHLCTFSELMTIYHGDSSEDRYHDVLRVRCACGDEITIGKLSLDYDRTAHGKWAIIDTNSYEVPPVKTELISSKRTGRVPGAD